MPKLRQVSPECVAKAHPRVINWKGASALALGGSNQSLFIIGALLAAQGTAAVPLLIGGLLLSWMALPGWLELTLMWPDRVGGIAAVCAEAFRPYSAVLANLTGVCYWWGWVPTCAVTATMAAAALHAWYLPQVPVTALALAMILAAAATNLCGVRWASRLAQLMAAASGVLALISGIAPVLAGTVDWHRATSFHLITPFHGAFGTATALMAGLYIVGFAAPAFEAAACHTGEMRDPLRGQPRAMYASAIAATLYFVLLPVVWLGVLGAGPLQGDLGNALGPVFAPLFGPLARAAAVWFIVLNLLHGTLQPMSGPSRTLLQLAEDGLLPWSFAKRSARTDAPWVAIIVTAAAASVVALMGAPVWVIAAANLTYLIGICLPSVAVWLLRRDDPDRPRPYRARPGLIELGLLAGAVWLIATLLGFEQYGLPTVITGLAFAYAGSVGYLWRRMRDRQAAGLPRRRSSLHGKLTGSMLAVIAADGTGYLLAITQIHHDPVLKAVLQDIFVAVAVLTITVGLVLPGMIGQAASELARAASDIAQSTVAELGRGLQALADGRLESAHANVEYHALQVYSRDELGEMARSFNAMSAEIAAIAHSLDEAREGVARSNQELLAYAEKQAGLAEAELEARRSTEAANRAKSAFLSRASHELRTPLNAILGFGQLLQMSDLDDQQRASVEQLLRGGDRLRALIDDLLHISKLQGAPEPIPLTELNLSRSIRSALSLLKPQAQAAGVSLVSDLPRKLPIRGNLEQLNVIFLNLLTNAIKYNREGGSVSVRGEIRADGSVQITVNDTGVGIEPDVLHRLFSPFDRLGAENTSVQGTGLGLALTKQSVEALHGEITVDSEPGVGSTFTVALPGPTSVPAATQVPQEQHYAGSTASAARRLLYVEDDPVNQEILARLVARRDELELDLAGSAEEARAYFSDRTPDLVLLDLNLQDDDGEIVLDDLRKDPATSRIPVVIVSADASEERQQRLLDKGAVAYHTKPIRFPELLGEIKRALS